MDFCIILQARLGSKRFPNKILKLLGGKKSVLEFQIDRILENKFNLIVATTKKKKDDKIIKILKKKNINFFRGSEANVYSRYKQASKKFNVKNIIRITSDCPFVDFALLKKMKKKFIKNNYDYIANTLPIEKSRFPNGSDIEIFKSSLFNKVKVKNNLDKEHVTNIFLKKKFVKKKVFTNIKNLSNFRYTLDYKEDLIVLRAIHNFFSKNNKVIGVTQICDFLSKNKKLQNKNSSFNKIFQGSNV